MQQWSPALWQAAGRGDHATVLRLARVQSEWTQDELGQRFGCSGSTISRLETGRRPLRDVAILRRLASILSLPPEAFGLTKRGEPAARFPRPGTRTGQPPGRRACPPADEGDSVRRREFLQLAVLTGSALAWAGTSPAAAADLDPAAVLTRQLGDVLLGAGSAAAEPVDVGVLAGALASARREFAACQYVSLARRLPALLETAEATAASGSNPAAHRVLAESYNLTTRALIKLEASGLEWISADRGLHAARAAETPLTLAESQRLVASVARRADLHERAQELTLDAASGLDVSGRHPEHLAMYGTLYLSAAYAAARAGDRERADDLLAEAEVTAGRMAGDDERQRALVANLVSHRVSAAYVLGNAGTALAYAQSLPLAAVPTTERRARLLVDTAMAYAQWDKPDQAYRTLLVAERIAPGEVRTRNAVRRLVGDLMNAPRQAGMPGLSALAGRVHAVA